MDTESLLNAIEEAVDTQLALSEGGEAVEDAAVALMAALRPALQQAALRLAEQAALEVSAQLDGYSVSVVLEDGEPSLAVREDSEPIVASPGEMSARITLRLPDSLKDDLESAAGSVGDSVNAYVIKALSSRASRRSERRITETFDT